MKNARSNKQTMTRFESLERRQMFSGGANDMLAAADLTPVPTLDARGTLLVRGTSGNDDVSVRKNNGVIEVSLNGQIERFNASDVKRIRATLGSGDDTFAAHGTIRHRMIVDGQAGSDNIRTGFGSDLLIGGDGNDALNANFGNDELLGGAGRDHLVSGPRHQIDPGFAGLNNEPDQNVIRADDDLEFDTIQYHPEDTIHANGFDLLRRLDPPHLSVPHSIKV